MKTFRLSAALAALTLTASTTCAAVIDLSNALGPSGRYTTDGYYQGMLGGQPMTGAQQAYADREGQLRRLGFLSELSGDIALGQVFYHMAYGITMLPSPSALDLAGEGSDVRPPSDVGYTDADPNSVNAGSVLTLFNSGGPSFALAAAPEPSTWALMLLGFAGLAFAGYRASRRTSRL